MCKCIYVKMSTNYRDTSTLLHWRWSLDWVAGVWMIQHSATTTSHHLLWLLSSSFFLRLPGWQISDDGTFSRQSWCVNKTAAVWGCCRDETELQLTGTVELSMYLREVWQCPHYLLGPSPCWKCLLVIKDTFASALALVRGLLRDCEIIA